MIQHEVSQVECRIGEVASIVNGSMGTIPESQIMTNFIKRLLVLKLSQEGNSRPVMPLRPKCSGPHVHYTVGFNESYP